MAKLILEVDTESHEMSVSIGGENIENANYISVYRYMDYEGKPRVECTVQTHEKGDNGVSKHTSYHAHGSEKAKNIPKDKVISTIAGFIGVKENEDLTTELGEFFVSKLPTK